ncbi:hypothetical protein [Alloactinosynnema sp. L-07]|nr:hypothetical protein [Alloactinosynnema sp. L-07]
MDLWSTYVSTVEVVECQTDNRPLSARPSGTRRGRRCARIRAPF